MSKFPFYCNKFFVRELAEEIQYKGVGNTVDIEGEKFEIVATSGTGVILYVVKHVASERFFGIEFGYDSWGGSQSADELQADALYEVVQITRTVADFVRA